MSRSPHELSIAPLPHQAMDYAWLRAEALRLLERLAGEQWTDFNTHDPGITILEQLCYAITDLAYRTQFPIPDLVAASPDPGLPGPEEVLSNHPVTRADLRSLILGAGPGATFDAVRVEALTAGLLPIYYQAESHELRFQPPSGSPEASPVYLRGLHRVRVHSPAGSDPASVGSTASARLHATRPLGEDFEVEVAPTFHVRVTASIEVGPVDDPSRLRDEIVARLKEAIAPPPRFLNRAEVAGQRPDRLYEGPLLDRGFLSDATEPRTEIYASDLIRAIHAVPNVRAVRSMAMSETQNGKLEQWVLRVPTGEIPALDPKSDITLRRSGTILPTRPPAAARPYRVPPVGLKPGTPDPPFTERPPPRSPARPAGRDRHLARHFSLQRNLPAAYGLGMNRPPPSASALRRAQARQLEGYLVIFDQLLANAFAQLSHAHELLSASEGSRSYFAQPPLDPLLDIQSLLASTPAEFRDWLDAEVEPEGQGVERRTRFLAHLLARFGEELTHVPEPPPKSPMLPLGIGARTLSPRLPTASLLPGTSAVPKPPLPSSPFPIVPGGPVAGGGDDVQTDNLERHRALLRRIGTLGAARGTGFNLWTNEPGGYQERLRLKLGGAASDFFVVEHILLRAVPEDRFQVPDEAEEPIPLIAEVGRDPWSLHVSLVLQGDPEEGSDLETFVARTVREETPAHLAVDLIWVDGEDWTRLSSAWSSFRSALQAYRTEGRTGGDRSRPIQLTFRDARDRLIELLGIGTTWPLRDIPLPRRVAVTPGGFAKIFFEFRQEDVGYQLYNVNTGQRVDKAAPGLLPGRLTVVQAGPFDADTELRVLATKPGNAGAGGRLTWIEGVVQILVGVDSEVVAQIVGLPLLDPRLGTPLPHHARIAEYGASVQVEVLQSQEGVTYELVDDRGDLPFDTRPSLGDKVVGTSGRVVLTLGGATEDIDLRVRGSRATGSLPNSGQNAALLDVVLPLRVRANPAIAPTPPGAAVDWKGAGAFFLWSSQPGVEYEAWAKGIRDAEFAFGDDSRPTADVTVDGRLVQVVRPSPSMQPRQLLFQQVGGTQKGTGRTLAFGLGAFTADTMFLVTASKRHRAAPLSSRDLRTVSSVVQLDRAVVLLVRPDPAPALRLRVDVEAGATVGPWTLLDGHPGVFYSLRSGSTVLGLPAYFHQRDDQDALYNKGVDQLRVEVDLVVTEGRSSSGDPATVPPPPPRVEVPPTPLGTEISIVARKAMTGLETTLILRATLSPVPSVTAEPVRVSPGEGAHIIVAQSVVGERYALLRNDVPVAEARPGTGGDISLPTGPILESTTFEVSVENDDGNLPVERRVRVTVEV